MGRTAAILVVAGLMAASPAAGQEQQLRVVVRPGLELHEIGDGGTSVGTRGFAFGLVVPDAGPRTSQSRALQSLVRGKVVNSLRGQLVSGEVLITAEAVPLSTNESRVAWLDIAVGIPEGGDQPNDRRYVALLGAPGRRALLISESTRIPGLISIVDVAPTALGREGALTTQPHDDPVGYLRDLDARIRDNNTARLPAMLAVLAVIAALAFLRPRAAVLAFANVAAVNLALGVVGVSSPWLVIVVLPLAAALALLQASRLGDGALGVTLASVIVAYLLAMALEPPSVALSPLGPTQNSRFYGFSNLLETLFLVPALAAAALLRRSWAFFAVAALTVVTVAGSRFGADAGGAVVLAAGYAALALALLPRRIALGTLGALAAATALALVVGPSTHLGNADLPEALAERVSLSFARATDNLVVALVVVAAVAALAVLVLRLRRLGLPPQQRALPVALAVAVACSLVVNDSPLDVSLIGLVSYLTLERFVRDRETESHPYNSGVPREGVVSP